MKHYILVISFSVFLLGNKSFAQVGALTNSPAPSAILDLRDPQGGTKGLLTPQVSLNNLTDGSLIAGGIPAVGLVVYNTNAALPSGIGYYYWESGKWNKFLNQANLTGDNLGNHTATQDLNMSGFNINQAAKTATQTIQIKTGTDGNPPNIGDVATAADAVGNVVWRPYPNMQGQTNRVVTATSNSSTFAPATLGNWNFINGLYNVSYIANATGTLLVKAIVYLELDDISVPKKTVMYQSGVRFTARTGGSVIADPGGTAYGYQTILGYSDVTVNASGKNPNSVVLFTQFHVTKGTYYVLALEYSDFLRINDTKPSVTGNIISVGGNSYASYLSGVLIPD